jgi:hypothetical protein
MIPALALLLALAPASSPKPAPRPAPPATGAVRILAPGTYARTEVAKDAAGTWWALVREQEAFSLRPTAVRTSFISLDEARPRVLDGVEVTTPEVDEAVLLVRGLKLAAGPAPGADGLRVEGSAAGDQKVAGSFLGEPFELWSEPLGEASPRAILRLRMGTSTHALLMLEDCEDCTWDLLWAGDLDGDARLDALVGTTHRDNKGLMRLFLSSKAKAPAPAGLAATHAWDFGD